MYFSGRCLVAAVQETRVEFIVAVVSVLSPTLLGGKKGNPDTESLAILLQEKNGLG